MMGKPLRYIIVGIGSMGTSWCKLTLPRLAELGKAIPAAAVDIDVNRLQNAKDHLGLSTDLCFTDINTAFDKVKADFAIIVTQPNFHEAVVDAALAHDMDILSEKPIADKMETCCRIYKKVTSAGKKMAVTMTHRFDQDKQSLEAAVQNGEYGHLDYVVGRFTMALRKFGAWGAFRHEMPDPLLIEGTVHHFDIFRGLARSDCETVYAVSWNPTWGEYGGDSQALITMKMTNGVKCFWEGAKCNATTLNGWAKDYIRAECESGTLEFDARRLRLLNSRIEGEITGTELPMINGEVWRNEWLAEMFCDWLSGEREEHPTRLEDNIQCAALLYAAVESAHTGQPINVQHFLQQYMND